MCPDYCVNEIFCCQVQRNAMIWTWFQLCTLHVCQGTDNFPDLHVIVGRVFGCWAIWVHSELIFVYGFTIDDISCDWIVSSKTLKHSPDVQLLWSGICFRRKLVVPQTFKCFQGLVN